MAAKNKTRENQAPWPKRMRARGLGPMKEVDITFGDLTVLVGPQATGKSIFLQTLKFIVDMPAIEWRLDGFGYNVEEKNLLDFYYGEGMASIWTKKSSVQPGQVHNLIKRTKLPSWRHGGHSRDEKMFYIPAQRVTSLRDDGMPRSFVEYRSGAPFVLVDFSQKLHDIVNKDLTRDGVVFPQEQRIAADLRRPLEEHIFGGFHLDSDTSQSQRRLVLRPEQGNFSLPFLVWSAGQREFVPLLLGFYWLLTAGGTTRREELEWVVIEEPEMGLHPNGISAIFNLVLELLLRGYRVCLSTHSPHVLDLVWALRFFQEEGGDDGDVLKLLELPSSPKTQGIAKCALESKYRTYYFERGGDVRDISPLDPGSEDDGESGWGGLTGFSGRVGEVVAEVANRGQGQAR